MIKEMIFYLKQMNTNRLIPFGEEILNTACSDFEISGGVQTDSYFYLYFTCFTEDKDIREIVKSIFDLNKDCPRTKTPLFIDLEVDYRRKIRNLCCVGINVNYNKSRKSGGFHQAGIVITFQKTLKERSLFNNRFRLESKTLKIWLNKDN